MYPTVLRLGGESLEKAGITVIWARRRVWSRPCCTYKYEGRTAPALVDVFMFVVCLD